MIDTVEKRIHNHFSDLSLDYWLASSVVSRTNQHLGYLIDVILAASGKIRDNVEALGAEQVDSAALCVDQVFIKSLKRLCETGRVKLISILFCQGSTFDERRRLLRGAWAKKTLWAMAGWDSQHHQHGGQVLLLSDVITLNLFSRRLILGDTFNAEKLRYTAKEMLLANSKKLDSIPDWRNKLATRTELVLEVLGELARSSL